MQEFIDCLPWHFCWEGKRALHSPSALITGSWQCYLSLVKDKPKAPSANTLSCRSSSDGESSRGKVPPGRFYSDVFDVLGALTTI